MHFEWIAPRRSRAQQSNKKNAISNLIYLIKFRWYVLTTWVVLKYSCSLRKNGKVLLFITISGSDTPVTLIEYWSNEDWSLLSKQGKIKNIYYVLSDVQCIFDGPAKETTIFISTRSLCTYIPKNYLWTCFLFGVIINTLEISHSHHFLRIWFSWLKQGPNKINFAIALTSHAQ